MFREKAFPQVTGFVVVLAFAGAIIGALGYATPPVLVAMAAVLVLDIAILFFSHVRLVCYNCRTSYHGIRIARYHRSWDRTTADRFTKPSSTTAESARTESSAFDQAPTPPLTTPQRERTA